MSITINLAQMQQALLLQPGNEGPDNPQEDGPDDWRVRIIYSESGQDDIIVPNKDAGNRVLGHIEGKRREHVTGELAEEEVEVEPEEFINEDDVTADYSKGIDPDDYEEDEEEPTGGSASATA